MVLGAAFSFSFPFFKHPQLGHQCVHHVSVPVKVPLYEVLLSLLIIKGKESSLISFCFKECKLYRSLV